MGAETLRGWTQTLQKVAALPDWKAALDKHNWRGAPLYGPELRNFVDYEQTTARVIIHLLRLQA